MRLKTIALLCAAAAALAACADVGKDVGRPDGVADAKVFIGKRRFSIWFRGQDTSLVMERSRPSGVAQVVSTLTLNAVTVTAPAPYWRAAAQAVLTPLGCTVVDVHPLEGPSRWEARYACPVGTDIAHEVEHNRDVWREGVLMADPMAQEHAP